jgi:hypothetical protein
MEKYVASRGRVVFCALLLASLALAMSPAEAQQQEAARRDAIAQKGRDLFKNTGNHCHAFRDLAAFAVTKVDAPGPLLDDLMLVLIGKSLRERGTGTYYIGNTPGARGDKGFKDDLQDGSPQVEHGFAAIYIGKMYPPGTTEAVALRTEVMGPLTGEGKLNSADLLLYAIGGDIGQRLSGSNYEELSKVIERTMCK